MPALEQPWLEEENTLKQLLLRDTDLEMREPSSNLADRTERMYQLRWKDPRDGEDPHVWLRGMYTPRTNRAEIEAHFAGQISRLKKQRPRDGRT